MDLKTWVDRIECFLKQSIVMEVESSTGKLTEEEKAIEISEAARLISEIYIQSI